MFELEEASWEVIASAETLEQVRDVEYTVVQAMSFDRRIQDGRVGKGEVSACCNRSGCRKGGGLDRRLRCLDDVSPSAQYTPQLIVCSDLHTTQAY